MNPSAIHEAIRLYKHPEKNSWITESKAPLPEGITELLRLTSSHEKTVMFAEKNHTDAEDLKKLLLNFIDKVLLNENNTDEKVLGIEDKLDCDTTKLHYHLLIRILHPDRNPSPDAVTQAARITKAYTTIKSQQNTSNEYKNIRISRVPPNSYYQATSNAEQAITNVKTVSIVAMIATLITAVWIGGYFYELDNSELISINTQDTQHSLEKEHKDSIPVNIFTEKKPPLVAVANSSPINDKFQSLLSSVEIAYENGDASKIQTILNSPEIKQQPDNEVLAKLKNLFQITSHRKMLLYDFEWKNISGKITGKGKFLSRYHLSDNDQWLTREGVASIIAVETNRLLSITSLKLDNNIIKY